MPCPRRRCSLRPRGFSPSAQGPERRLSSGAGGQMHDEGGTLARAALNLDRAAMKLEHHGDQMKSDTAAGDPGGIASAIVALEEVDPISVGNSDAVVAYMHQQAPSRFRPCHHFDRTARRGVFDGIG